ncbi:hypothetical protein CYMTET_47117, partial [Cymbomonas tetramitiformis]
LLLVALRGVLAQAAYYLHLTGFWYLLDEDFGAGASGEALPMTTTRNLFFGLGFIPLYASGCFFNDAV